MAPLEDGGDETRIEIQQEDEVEPAKIAPGPRQPSAKEEKEHRIDHALYRSWCKWCVMGRARGAQHRLGDGSTIPIIGIDYFFITKEGVKKKKELIQLGYKSDGEIEDARQKGEILKCTLTRCYSSKCIFAHCVPCKGADEEQYVSNLVVDDILWLGHLKMILKADNEPAVHALLLQVLRKVRSTHQNVENVTKEQPAKYESQSNGGTEVGVMLVRGLFRTLIVPGGKDRPLYPSRSCNYPVALGAYLHDPQHAHPPRRRPHAMGASQGPSVQPEADRARRGCPLQAPDERPLERPRRQHGHEVEGRRLRRA